MIRNVSREAVGVSEGEQIQQPDQELGHGRGGDGARGREDQDPATQTPAQLRDTQHHGGDTPGTDVFTNSLSLCVGKGRAKV